MHGRTATFYGHHLSNNLHVIALQLVYDSLTI